MRAYTDGACRVSNPGQCSAAFAVYCIGSLQYEHARYLGPELHTNNYAEYQGLLDLLRWAEAEKITGLDIHCDSQLVVKQVRGEWAVKHKELQPLHDLAFASTRPANIMLDKNPTRPSYCDKKDKAVTMIKVKK